MNREAPKVLYALWPAVLVASVLLALLVAARTEAQEVRAGDASVKIRDGETVVRAGDVVVKTGGGTNIETTGIETGSLREGSRQGAHRESREAQTPAPATSEGGAARVPSEDDGRGRALVAQAAARPADPLEDQAASIADTDNDNGIDTIGPIAVADCVTGADATVTVRDDDGTEVVLTNGGNVDVTATSQSVEATGADEDENLDGIDPNNGGNNNFDLGPGTVVSSTGITCGNNTDGSDDGGGDGGGASNPSAARTGDILNLSCTELLQLVRDGDAGQYDADDGVVFQRIQTCLAQEVLDGTAPEDKPLPNTGGPPLLGLAALGLAVAVVGMSVVRAGTRRG